MKKILSVLFSSLLLLSCSSMEVPFEEIYGDLLPLDFNWLEFRELNPDIKCAQSLSDINSLNSEWRQKDSLRIYDSIQNADNNLSTAVIRSRTTSVVSGKVNQDNSNFIGNQSNPGPGVDIAKMCYQWTDNGLIAQMFAETATNFASLRFYIFKYNLYERDGEIEFIENFQVNPAVYSETYIKYGRTEGRPYRACRDSEKQTRRSDLSVDSISVQIVGGTGAGSSRKEPDYSKYKFCADTGSPKPYLVYEIPQ